MHEFDDPKFKKAFWEWFDSLSVAEKDKFKYYPADMAELNFHNRIYKHLEQ